MTLRSTLLLFAAAALASAAHAADPPAPPAIPAEITAMLLEHRGEWRTEGWIIEGEKRTPVKASWECKAAVNGVGNVCTWYHEWVDRPHDMALDIMGYDPRLKVLSISRITDTGVVNEPVAVTVRGNSMIVDRQITKDGKPAVLHNNIVVTKPGEWSQHITIEVDGKQVREINLTQRRVAATTRAAAPPPDPSAAAEIPAEILAWIEGQRGNWRSEGVIIKGDERTPAAATWECRAAVNGIGNVCTWNHEWTDRPHDSALEIMGYDPRLKTLSITRVNDNGIINEPVAVPVPVQGNTMTAERQMTENGKPAVMRNEIVVKSPDERSQRMWVEVDGKVVREFIITHRRVK